ncbi:MAG: hypothetical protein ACTHK1_07605 [Actinomycetales bacterium]
MFDEFYEGQRDGHGVPDTPWTAATRFAMAGRTPSATVLAELEALDTSRCSDAELVEAIVAWQAFAGRVQVGLWEAVTAFASRRPRLEPDGDPGADWNRRVSSHATAEIAAALNLPLSSADRLAAQATTVQDTHSRLVASFKAGRLNWSRFNLLTRGLDCVDPEVREAIVDAVLPDAEGSASNGALRNRLRRAVIAADPEAAARRAQHAAATQTRLVLNPREDAMAALVATAPAVDLVGVHAAIDAFAKALREAGAPGQLATLRVRSLQELVLTHPAITGLPAWQQALASCDSSVGGIGSSVGGPDSGVTSSVGGIASSVGSASADQLQQIAALAFAQQRGSAESSDSAAETGDPPGLQDDWAAEAPLPPEPGADEIDPGDTRRWVDPAPPREDWSTRIPDDAWRDEHPLDFRLASAPACSLSGLGGLDGDGRLALGLPLSSIPTLGCGSAGRFASLTLVAVPYDVLLGTSEAPGELAGYGPLPAPLARAIAADPTGTWQRLVTDPLTGSLQDFGTSRYRPPAKLAGHVITRDWTCRAPGCSNPATVCDLDHATPYANAVTGGTTCAENLIPLCRRHHRAKTFTNWKVRRDSDGSVHWTAPTGHVYITRPDGPLSAGCAPPRMGEEGE